MKDYFSNLVARVFPVAPPVRPRRSSLFESAASVAPHLETIDERPAAPPPPAVEPLQPQAVRPSSAETPPSRLPSPPPFTSLPPAPLAPVEPVRPLLRPDSSMPTPTPKNPVASPSTPSLGPVVAWRGMTDPPGTPAPAVAPMLTTRLHQPAPAPDSPRRLNAPADTVQPPVSPRVAPTPILAPPLVPQAMFASSASPGLRRADPGGEARPAPPVRVTIGRVEIRAILPVAPVAAKPGAVPPVAPVISLDDYLKQRPASRA